jgi:hypothetical protein
MQEWLLQSLIEIDQMFHSKDSVQYTHVKIVSPIVVHPNPRGP